jgi:nucleotide-binding universal stress UspA family protein
MSKPVIVGLDPQRKDASPLHLAAGLARVTDAPLIAIASYPHDPNTGASSGAIAEADPRADAATRLESLAAGIGAELAVTAGSSAARVLRDAAIAHDASVIVVGSMHDGWLGRLSPGTTSERLLHGAPCPIAIAPAGLNEQWTLRRVGVGFIDRDDGHQSLRSAAALTAAAGASLHALTAVEPLDWSQPAANPPHHEAVGLMTAQATARRALHLAIESLPRNVDATRQVVVGHAADALITLSTEVDLLVCGSPGHGPLRTALVGSVTRRLTRSANCPVVIVSRGVEWSIDRGAIQQGASAR